MAQLVWERVEDFYKEEKNDLSRILCGTVMRAKVPGGWPVRVLHSYGFTSMVTDTMIFIPDPNHEWK